MAVLCGVGFTMSLFIGALAFRDPSLIDETKIGVLAGFLGLRPRGSGDPAAGEAVTA
ncbi:Na+/H+ antiporter NhaA [Caulobacter segnis]